MLEKIKGLSPAWLVTAISIAIMVWVSFAGGAVEDKEIIIQGKTYNVSYTFDPGVEKIIEQGIECKEKLTVINDECEFNQKAIFKIKLIKIEEVNPVLLPSNGTETPDTTTEETPQETPQETEKTTEEVVVVDEKIETQDVENVVE